MPSVLCLHEFTEFDVPVEVHVLFVATAREPSGASHSVRPLIASSLATLRPVHTEGVGCCGQLGGPARYAQAWPLPAAVASYLEASGGLDNISCQGLS
jgi:hypothetical protein